MNDALDTNCLSYWFPLLVEAGLPLPSTLVAQTDVTLLELLDGKTPDGWQSFRDSLHDAIMEIGGYPIFLRTGHTSGKHRWRNTCYLSSPEFILQHVVNLVEVSECAGIIGLPCDVWVVRELLPTEPICKLPRYCGMPLCREFRCFARGGEVLCMHPYWPYQAVLKGTIECGRPMPKGLHGKWQEMCRLSPPDLHAIHSIAQRASQVVEGEWSVDILWTSRGWYLIDMALAEDSWHWLDCPRQNTKGIAMERWRLTAALA